MVFASPEFLFAFLPAFFLLYAISGKLFGMTGKNTALFICSLFFYAWGEPVYVLLMIYSSLLDYFCGRAIYSGIQRQNKVKSRIFLTLSMVGNLALLVIFKYSGFIAENINALIGTAIPVPSLSLPIGISFYTFQTMSYSIDVYRGKITPQKNFINFGAYVAMFPQLIAGPVVRYSDIASQLDERHTDFDGVAQGTRRFIIGLAKKVLIANTMAEVADSLFALSSSYIGSLGAWIAVISYTFQIYFDFSGYSDMAIGLGRILGFTYPENFNYPYISRSVTDFWRRWHITMSSFFRDYVYIPLGGNRCSKLKWLRNVLVVWFLTGLWHGAAWHYVLWGLYFAMLLILEKYLLGKFLEKHSVFSHIYSVLLIVFGWVIFRCETVSQIGSFFGAMFGSAGLLGTDSIPAPVYLQRAGVNTGYLIALLFAILFSMPVLSSLKRKIADNPNSKFYRMLPVAGDAILVILLIASSVSLALGSYNPFIYFDF